MLCRHSLQCCTEVSFEEGGSTALDQVSKYRLLVLQAIHVTEVEYVCPYIDGLSKYTCT